MRAATLSTAFVVVLGLTITNTRAQAQAPSLESNQPTPKRPELADRGLPTKPVADTKRIVLSTGVLRRELSIDAGRLGTTRLKNELTNEEVSFQAAAEFSLRFMDGSTATAADYRVAEHRSSETNGEQRETFQLVPADPKLPRLRVEYSARHGDHFLRKKIEVTGEKIVDSLSVDQLPWNARAEVGGLGQPVFMDGRWFAGLEYPAGTNNLIGGGLSLVHHPGRASFASKSAVLGGVGAAGGRIEDEFERYLATIRRPARSSLQYNGWFDRRDGEITPESMRATFDIFQRELLAPFDLRFDAFVVDDGYQNLDSIWECSDRWPQGFAPFARYLESHGSRLGLWLPLNGYRLNTQWGGDRGLERSNHRKRCYCLAGPKYQAEIREALRRRIRDGNLAYFKHDFNFLQCSADGHGHLATDRHGLEANVDAQIVLLQHERELQPDIFLNITSDIWPSPWWLQHAETLWMGASDYNHDWTAPQWSRREAEMTFRDGQLYRRLRQERAQTPASAYMTHGMIRGRYEGIDPAETLAEWSDYVMMYLGRGTLLHELYISPDQMPPPHWQVLGRALRWARANVETLQHTRMVGGQPLDGDVYGYVHWSAERGIFCLRNPSQRPVVFELSLAERPRHLPDRPRWHPIVIYPQRRLLEPLDSSAATVSVKLPSASVTLIELWPELPESLAWLPPGPFEVVEEQGGLKVIRYEEASPVEVRPLDPPDDQKKHWRAALALEGNAAVSEAELRVVREPADASVVSVDVDSSLGEQSKRVAPGPADWALSRWPLRLDGRTRLDLSLSLPPSPFWPERGVTAAVLRTTRELEVVESRQFDRPTDWAGWPMALEPGTTVDESVLVEDKVLERRRSSGESLLWVVALGIVPLLGVRWLVSHGLRHQPSWRRAAVGLLAIGLLMTTYAMTPLAAALARALK